MEYIHVKNIEKFHPGYKDRTLQWAKIYINMAEGDPDTEMIENEIDWCRFVKIILLELRAQKPLPNITNYWIRKGFDLKKRPMLLTLKMLHNFLEVVTNPLRREEKEEDKEEEKDKEIGKTNSPQPSSLYEAFKAKATNLPQPRELTKGRLAKCRLRLKERSLEEWGAIFERMDASEFCRGENDRKWKADFDWIIKNEENAVKVLEGKYDKRIKLGDQSGFDKPFPV